MFLDSPMAINTEFKQFPGGNTPDPRFGGREGKKRESLFLLSKNVLKLSYNNFSRRVHPGPPFLGRKSLFSSPKMFQNSPTAMQNYKIYPGVMYYPRTTVLVEGREGKGKFVLFSDNLLKLLQK